MKNNRVNRVMNESLSHITFTNGTKQKVLAEIKGETVVKKKLSTGLALALALVLVAGLALAVMSLRDTGRQIVETEQTDGFFVEWPVEKKTSLVYALVSLGYVEESAEVKQLLSGAVSESDADRIANEAVSAYAGTAVSEVSFMQIMQAAWGPFSQWTKEEQAWYSQLMVDVGIQQSDHTLYTLPEGPVDEAQAIALARQEVAKGYGVEESALDVYTVITSFQVPEFADAGDTQPYWYIEFSAPETMPTERRLFNTMWVFLHPETGQPIQSVASMLEERRVQEVYQNDPLFQQIGAFEMEHGYFNRMSHESRALWSQTIRPLVQKKQQDDPSFFHDEIGDASLLSTIAFMYGLPDEKAMTEAEALALAERALVEVLGRDAEEVPFYTHRMHTYYDITDPEKPLWKFFFQMPNEYDSDKAYAADLVAYYGKNGERRLNYKVEINAYTGEIVNAYGIELGDVDTLEDWKQLV